MEEKPVAQVLENYEFIKETYELLNNHVKLGISIHPAGEWLLDNFYLVEETTKIIKRDINKNKYNNFVKITHGEYKGLARIYILAKEIVKKTEGNIEAEKLEEYLNLYQTKENLNMDEIWNIGIFLQMALIENIKQICEGVYVSQIEKYKVESIIERLVEEKEHAKFGRVKLNKNFKQVANMQYPFIEYMSYKLKRYGKETEKYLKIFEEEVEKTGTTVAEVIRKEHFDVAIKKVTMGNCILSIKRLQRMNFLEIFEKTNCVEDFLKQDPAHVYSKMDYKTKDYYRQKIKEIAKKTKVSEIYIAKKLLELSKENFSKNKKGHIGYYLFGKNVKFLYTKIGCKPPKVFDGKQKSKLYILSILVLSIIVSVVVTWNFASKISLLPFVIGVLLLIIPASEFVIQIMQYILGKFVKPKPIPKMDFSKGIDKKDKTIVVIPTILKDTKKVQKLVRKLEVSYLANKSDNLYFCLLGDCSESQIEIEDFDKKIVEEGTKGIDILNEKYGKIFYFLYRKRRWNDSQGKYLGWERKRGALTEFVNLLQGRYSKKEIEDRFWVAQGSKEIEGMANLKCKFCITLDSDTDLILNSASELVGAMAHPLNKPEIEKGKVKAGYGIIQPRIGINIEASYKNKFTKIFAGSGGIDLYTNAISDIYQDNFEEGIFTGKGIFDIDLYEKVLKKEIPENTVLSHDLLEGCYLRCGLATDIFLMDEFPTKYESFIKRLSRWIRGDWQIIRWLKNKKINLLSKFKIFDNLRRSLVEISILICAIYFLILCKNTDINVYKVITFLVIALAIPFLLEILNIVILKKEGEQKQKGFTSTVGGIAGAFYRAILTLGVLPFKAYVSLKSICKSLYRMLISKRNLLEWETFEESEKNSKDSLVFYYSMMWINVVFGILAIISLNIFFVLLGTLWVITPFVMCNISKEKLHCCKNILNVEQKQYVLEIAKQTFLYFKDNLTEENNFLIPDNFQQDRKQKYVDRTSATNIGLSLLSIIAGIDLEFISYKEGIEIIKKIIETVESLEKWHGHLYNWYNIKTKNALMPKYVSTVDSGNFVGYLYVLKAFLKDENLKQRVSNLIDCTDFSKLYSNKQRLFSIGFNIEENKLTDSYYDLLATEARQASLIAIAKKDVTSKHWNNLGRTLTVLNNKKGLISWSGTAFEYLMPNINIPKFKGSILDESSKFTIMSQIEYAKKLKIPWGISEAAFNIKDFHSNYQYKAFGIPWLGLKRGLGEETVVAPYASILAITEKPLEVYKNLRELEKYGMKGKYGFYESLDFSMQRLKKGEKWAIVKTYMAHHQALILLSINNLMNENIFQKRFMQNPEIEAVSILLQERMPETLIITKEEKEKPNKLKYQDYENYVEVVYDKIDNNLIRANVISNENYMVAINQEGQGVSKYKDIYINRYKNTDDYKQGIFFYIKNVKTKEIWKNVSENTVVTFMPDQDKMERVNGNIKTTTQITVDTNEPVEIRRIKLENIGNIEEMLEVSAVFEPVLSTKDQDYAHPAFNNLFLKFDYNYDKNYLQIIRKKRNKDENTVYMITKFLTEAEVIVDNEFEISIEKLDDRGNLGIPKAIVNSTPLSNKVGLVVEPLVMLKKTIRIQPNMTVYLDFMISVNEDKDAALENIEKYRTAEDIERTFSISKARVEAENRYLNLKAKDIVIYQKIMSYIIFENPLRRRQMEKISGRLYDQSKLWKYGISGDLPIILVKIRDINDTYIVKSILKMYEFFRVKNLLVDIVFLDEEKYSYENLIRGEIESIIADQHLEYMKNVNAGIFVFAKSAMNPEDEELLRLVSTLIIDTHKGDLYHIIKDMEKDYLSKIKNVEDKVFEKATLENQNKKQEQENILNNKDLKYYNEYGAFSSDGKEYLICQNRDKRLPTVWSHIMANNKFGTVVTENMGGYTWFKNSRLNRVTAWHNKPFLDIPSEIIYVQDEDTGKTWSLGLNPMPDAFNYNVMYGFGYAKYIHYSNEIYQELTVFVPNEDSIKIGILKLSNKSLQKKRIRIIYFVKPVLGEDEIKSNNYIKVNFDKNANVVYAQNIYESNFKTIMYLSSSEKIKSFTGDKKAFFGKGGMSSPDELKKYRLSNEDGIGRKACATIEIKVEIDSLSDKEIVLVLGAEENIVDLKNMAYKYSKLINCKQEFENVKKKWNNLLQRVQVCTPVESINIILNGWSIYQTITSRLIGRTGFYQSGGAFGFRDQLQDVLIFKYIDPSKIKEQILKHSEHQFIEGDVEHWWHEETGRGIRTRFSDDLLWLVFMVEQYIEATGDKTILDIETHYLAGETLKEGQDEKYDFYPSSNFKETIYKHCVRAINKAMDLGERGLPKIGTGDWNDGFSTVGNKGKGESIWLGFFLYSVMTKFIEFCKYKEDEETASAYSNFVKILRKNLNTNGWDGRWFKRAYTDDGDILGSIENEECRIDSISQSWSVISEAGDKDKKFISMESLENHLVDKENGIIKLLDPPFENGKLQPGYIKAYLPGVRENAGQYTHAAIWAIIAEAMLGFGDKATELYKMINPIEHSKTKEAVQKYKVEPYSIPADVYGEGNLAGRGGWTWYTGSSSWYYIAGIEYILGIKIRNNMLFFEPCIPKDWKEFSAKIKLKNSIYNIVLLNPNGKNAGVTSITLNGENIDCKNRGIALNENGGIFNIEIIL